MLKILKHWLGEKTARIPRTQIELKMEPIAGFRQERSPVAVGGKSASVAMRNKPAKDTRSGYFMSIL
jgi:hypothetical protein